MAEVNCLDRVADAVRRKDAEQRRADIVEWRWVPEPERTKWRELAMVAALYFSKGDTEKTT